MMLHFDCIIIGSGISGMTAAIYLKRANKNVLILEKGAPGGQINMTSKIENYPGFDSIDGPTLSMSVFKKVTDLKIEYKYGNVLDIKKEDDYRVITDREEFLTKKIIIATGRKPRELGLENEKQLIGKGISWCAICDGNLYKDQDVAVVGGGNSALEEALYLSNMCKKVYLIHRRDEFRADPLLQDKIKQRKNIELVLNSNVKKLNIEDNKLESINTETKNIKVKCLFIYIGFVPDTSFTNNLNLNKDHDYIIVDDSNKTNVEGIYACGDVIKKHLYQLTTAIGEGANAANSVIKEV